MWYIKPSDTAFNVPADRSHDKPDIGFRLCQLHPIAVFFAAKGDSTWLGCAYDEGFAFSESCLMGHLVCLCPGYISASRMPPDLQVIIPEITVQVIHYLKNKKILNFNSTSVFLSSFYRYTFSASITTVNAININMISASNPSFVINESPKNVSATPAILALNGINSIIGINNAKHRQKTAITYTIVPCVNMVKRGFI
jgi:hypothetical protein